MSDINDLMHTDPLLLTREDRTEIIKYLREQRHRYTLGDTKAGTMKPKAEPKALKGLGDLGIEVKI